MSLVVMTKVWQLKCDLKPTEMIVLLKLADNADEINHECFPSVPSIAKQCKVSERTVQRTLDKLKDKGLVSFSLRHRSNGACSSNVYKLHLDNEKDVVSEGDESLEGYPAKMSPPPRQNDRGDGVTGDGGMVTTLSPHINRQCNRHIERVSEVEKISPSQPTKDPFDFEFTENQIKTARNKKIDIQQEFEAFKDYWLGGELPKKFYGSRRFTTWLRGAREQKSGGNQNANNVPYYEQSTGNKFLDDFQKASRIRSLGKEAAQGGQVSVGDEPFL